MFGGAVRRERRTRDAVVTALAVLVVCGLVLVGATGTVTASEHDVPDPLEEGNYTGLELGAGETVTYDAELGTGDYFAIVAQFDSAADLEVAVYDPDGAEVGETREGVTHEGDAYHGVEIAEAPAEGTYVVEITNPTDDAATFDADVLIERAEHEVPEPLEGGYYVDLELGAGETVTYDAELTAGDRFVVDATFDSAADLGVAVYGPDGAEVGETYDADTFHGVQIAEAPADGTYVVEITNPTDDAATFDLYVEHDDVDPPEPDDVPEPLETGYYAGQAIDAGETLTYEADLASDDVFLAGIASASIEDVEVTVTDPDGVAVGTEIDDSFRGVMVIGAEDAGTYTVAVENHGDAASRFDLNVIHEGTSPLEEGTVEGSLESEEFDLYLVDLAEGDDLSIDVQSDDPDSLFVNVFDSDLESVDAGGADDEPDRVELSDVDAEGTYLIEVFGGASGVVEYALDVSFAVSDDGDAGDDEDGDGGDDGDDEDGSNGDDGDDGDNGDNGEDSDDSDDSDEGDDGDGDDGGDGADGDDGDDPDDGESDDGDDADGSDDSGDGNESYDGGDTDEDDDDDGDANAVPGLGAVSALLALGGMVALFARSGGVR